MAATSAPRIGVLAIQGAFREHVRSLCLCVAETVEIRTREDLEGLSGLVFPGGESTVMGKFLIEWGMMDRVRELILSDQPPLEAVFIRAPLIEKIGPGVEVLARVNGFPVAVRQRNVLATSFHPELTDDLRLHQWVVDMAGKN